METNHCTLLIRSLGLLIGTALTITTIIIAVQQSEEQKKIDALNIDLSKQLVNISTLNYNETVQLVGISNSTGASTALLVEINKETLNSTNQLVSINNQTETTTVAILAVENETKTNTELLRKQTELITQNTKIVSYESMIDFDTFLGNIRGELGCFIKIAYTLPGFTLSVYKNLFYQSGGANGEQDAYSCQDNVQLQNVTCDTFCSRLGKLPGTCKCNSFGIALIDRFQPNTQPLNRLACQQRITAVIYDQKTLFLMATHAYQTVSGTWGCECMGNEDIMYEGQPFARSLIHVDFGSGEVGRTSWYDFTSNHYYLDATVFCPREAIVYP